MSDVFADYVRECREGVHQPTAQELESIKNHQAYLRRIAEDPTYYRKARRLARKAAKKGYDHAEPTAEPMHG